MRLGLAIFLILALSACSGSKTLGFEEIRSNFLEASSAAAETLTFIDHVRQGRVTANFARGHAENLHEQIEQQIEELGKARPEAQFQADVNRCHGDLEQLRANVDQVASSLANDDSLARIADRVGKIHSDLQN